MAELTFGQALVAFCDRMMGCHDTESNELKWLKERTEDVPCDNVLCAYHDRLMSQNCSASYGTEEPGLGLCREYVPERI